MTIRFSRTTTGTVLFALDALLVLAVWPLMLLLSYRDRSVLLVVPHDAAILVYPAFNLLMLFAMGLYRRDAVLNAGRSVVRLPLIVGLGAGLGFLFSLILRPAAPPRLPEQALLFALAVATFTFCAFLARLVLAALVRG